MVYWGWHTVFDAGKRMPHRLAAQSHHLWLRANCTKAAQGATRARRLLQSPPPARLVFGTLHLMYRILLVCMGNICRSAMAESVMHAQLARMRLSGEVVVDSAGTYAGRQGEPPDSRAIELAKARGYPQIEQQRARRVQAGDFASFDLILAMDLHNLNQLWRECPPEHRHKMHLFLDYAGIDSPEEVPDPYRGDAELFLEVMGLCERGSEGVLQRVALERT